jgi:tRNA 2-thiouridine synthesizing protein A
MKIKVDAVGLKCPEPIMLLHKAIRESSHGDLIELTATDSSTERDIDKFCEFLGHKLIEKKISSKDLYFVVQKKDKNII